MRKILSAAAILAAIAAAPALADGPAPCEPGHDCPTDLTERAVRDDGSLLGGPRVVRAAETVRAGEEVQLSQDFISGLSGGVGDTMGAAACCCDDDVRVIVQPGRRMGARHHGRRGFRGGRRGRR